MKNLSKCLFVVFNVSLILGFANALDTKPFPKDFMFGVATAAYQVEGGWDADGKGENIWDHITHANASFVLDQENADVACDTYHKWKEDVKLLKDLGINHYRFSISWSRILPTGLADKVNDAGVSYYKDLIKALKEDDIEPVVTLYHWDLPQPLQDLGGWPSPDMADYFGKYARVVFKELGSDVKYWSTFNEPKQVCHDGYGRGTAAPAVVSPGVDEYLCAYTVLLAHAQAYHIYDDEFRDTQNGLVSIVLDTNWFDPVTNSTEDIEAAERLLQFDFGLYGNPIYNGNWPQVVIDRIKLRSEGEKLEKSRLPEFTDDQISYIKGTYDFVGVNSYRTTFVRDNTEAEFGTPSYEKDHRVREEATSDESWGLRWLLKWIKDTYNDPEILITENGVPDDGSTLEDDERIQYYSYYLSSVLDAIYEDEVKVIGYTAWSFLDNFEWTLGYSQHYGLYSVNFTSDDRTRTPKKSVDFYKKVIKTHCLSDEECSE